MALPLWTCGDFFATEEKGSKEKSVAQEGVSISVCAVSFVFLQLNKLPV